MRDIALARLTGAKVHFQHMSTCRFGRHDRRSEGRRPAGDRRGGAAPLHADRRLLRRLRRHLQGPPTAADRLGRGRDRRRGWRPERSTRIASDHAPHTPEDKERPFDHAPPGMLGWSTRWRWRSPSWSTADPA